MEKQYQLPKEFVNKWIKALRSGEFQQDTTAGQLSYNGCYCVLGVACVANGIPISDDGLDTVDKDGEPVNYDELKRVMQVQDTNFINVIYRLNDGKKLSFKQLADWIEQNVELI